MSDIISNYGPAEFAIKLNKIKHYIAKFKDPSKFINKILESLNHPFYIIDVKTYEIKYHTSATQFKENDNPIFCYETNMGLERPCQECNKKVICILKKVIDTKKPIKLHKFMNFQGKKNTYVEINATPIFNKNGEIAEIIRYDLSMDELKKKNQELKKTKNQLNLLMDSQNIGISQLDEKGNFKFANKVFCKMIGVPKSKLKDLNLLRDLEEEVKKKFKLKKEFSFDYSNNKRILSSNLVPSLQEKEFKGYFGTTTDTTELSEVKKEIKKYQEKANNSLFDKKVKERKILNAKEKLCLYGICKYPLASDQKLASKLNLNRSTVTAIKNRLKEDNWFNLVYCPNFSAVGGEVITLLINKWNLSKDKQRSSKIIKEIRESDELVFNQDNESQSLSFFVSKNYATIQRNLNKFYHKDLINNEEVKRLTFLLELDSLYVGCYSSLINHHFKLNLEHTPLKKIEKIEKNYLKNSINKKIFYSIAKFPECSIEELSKKNFISKPTISKIKKQLIENNLLIPKTMINLKKLGINSLQIVTFEFEQNISQRQKEKERKKFEPQTILKVKGKNKVTRMMFFEEKEGTKAINELREFYKKEFNPFEIIVTKHPLQQKTNFFKIDFATLLEQLIF
jgi:DNA-binding MarR family transcriptional regulator